MDPCHDDSFTRSQGYNTACEVHMCKGTMLDESLSVPQSRATIKNQTDPLRVVVFDEKTAKVFASLDPVWLM